MNQGYDIQDPFSKNICQDQFFNYFQAGVCLLNQKKFSEKSRPGYMKLGSQGQKLVDWVDYLQQFIMKMEG